MLYLSLSTTAYFHVTFQKDNYDNVYAYALYLYYATFVHALYIICVFQL